MFQPGTQPTDDNNEESEKTRIARPAENGDWQESQSGSSAQAHSTRQGYEQWSPPARGTFPEQSLSSQRTPVYREEEPEEDHVHQGSPSLTNEPTETYGVNEAENGYVRQPGTFSAEEDASSANAAGAYGPSSTSNQQAGQPVGGYHTVPATSYAPAASQQNGGYGAYQNGATGMQAAAATGNSSSQQPWGGASTQTRGRSGGLRTGAMLLLVLVLLLVFGTGLFAGWQFKRDQGSGSTNSTQSAGNLQQSGSQKVSIPTLNSGNLQQVREAVIEDVRPAVVEITVTTDQGQALGSGVIVDKNGYIVTNNHVVQGARSIDQVVLYDGKTVRNATLVGTDPADDLAVIKITPPTTLTTVPIGDSSKVAVGQDVLAIGSPLGDAQTVTSGIISAVGRNVSEQNGVTLPNALQTDAPINPGNSGGALVDLSGHLIGIPTLTAVDPEFNAPASGVGFAVASNRVNLVVPQLIKTGKVSHTGRAALGIQAVDVDQTVQAQDNLAVDHGALVAGVVSGGAAQKAGIQVGDVIVQIDSTAVTTVADLQDALISKNVGDKVTVQVYRGNQQMSFNVTLGELQSQQ